jgi:prevent-host-death family protein
MPVIKSISSLRNRTREITRICHEQDVPVYLTRNGEGALVVTSIDHYERLRAQAPSQCPLSFQFATSLRPRTTC